MVASEGLEGKEGRKEGGKGRTFVGSDSIRLIRFPAMTPQQKMTFFKMLVKIGYKEIEVAYPAASETDWGFVRKVVEDGEAGDDVFIQVGPSFPASCLWTSVFSHPTTSSGSIQLTSNPGLFASRSSLLLERISSSDPSPQSLELRTSSCISTTLPRLSSDPLSSGTPRRRPSSSLLITPRSSGLSPRSTARRCVLLSFSLPFIPSFLSLA